MPGVVSVGCKIPSGLIIQLYTMEDREEQMMGGNIRVVKRASPSGAPVKLNGFARHIGMDATHDIRYGAGITHGVDLDFINEWLKRNKDSDIVKKGLIFVQAKVGEIDVQAKDHRSLKSGLEPLDPTNLPVEFKGKISTADEQRTT